MTDKAAIKFKIEEEGSPGSYEYTEGGFSTLPSARVGGSQWFNSATTNFVIYPTS